MLICQLDTTPEKRDELNMAQANRVAKLFCHSVYYNGVKRTKERLLDILVEDDKLADASISALRRMAIELPNYFRWYWVPFHPKRRLIKILVQRR